MNKRFFLLLAFVCTGCVSGSLIRTVHTANSYSAKPENVGVLAEKRARVVRLSVAEAKPTDPNVAVNKIPVRKGMLLVSPSGTFAGFIHDALVKDLTDAGLYAAKSPVRIHLTLLKNQIDAPFFSKGTEVVVVRLQIFKHRRILLNKVYTSKKCFETHLSAAASMKDAIKVYTTLIQNLFARIYTDSAFIQAIKR